MPTRVTKHPELDLAAKIGKLRRRTPRAKIIIDCACQPPDGPSVTGLHFVGFPKSPRVSCAASDDRCHILKVIAYLGMHQWLDAFSRHDRFLGIATEEEVLEYFKLCKARCSDVVSALHEFSRRCPETWPTCMKILWRTICEGSISKLQEVIVREGEATDRRGRRWLLGVEVQVRSTTQSDSSEALETAVRKLTGRFPEDPPHRDRVEESRRDLEARERTRPKRKTEMNVFVLEIVERVSERVGSQIQEQSNELRKLLYQAIESAQKIKLPQGSAELSAFRAIGDTQRLLAYLLDHRNACTPAQLPERLNLDRDIVSLALLLGHPKPAEDAIEELLAHNPNDVDAIMRRGDIKCSRAQYDEAEADYSRALQLGRSSRNLVVLASALANLGLVALYKGNTDTALSHFLAALPLEEKNGRTTALGKLHNNIGLAYKHRGDIERAGEQFEESIELCIKANAIEDLANAYGNLGIVRNRQKKLEEASVLHQLAFDANRTIGRKLGMARAKGNLAFVFKSQGDLVRSEQAHREALALFQEIGDRAGEAAAHLAIAKLVFVRNGDLREVEECLRKALIFCEATDTHPGKAETHTAFAAVREKQGDLAAAISHLWKAADVYRRIGNRQLECMRLGRLLDLARQAEDAQSVARASARRAELQCDASRLLEPEVD